MDSLIDDNDIVNDPLKMVMSLAYVRESFFPLTALPNMLDDEFPTAEMLARDQNGMPAGNVFDKARECKQEVAVDLLALSIGVEHHLKWGQPTSSFNLAAETFFNEALIPKLTQLQLKNPRLDPRKIWLEITEQGGVPSNSDPKFLEGINDLGYRLALDDYNPNNPAERARLEIFGPFVKAVKLDYTHANTFRCGTDAEIELLSNQIRSIKNEFPQMIIVLEGVRGSDIDMIPKLLESGVQVVQESGYRGDGPVRPLDMEEIGLVLNR